MCQKESLVIAVLALPSQTCGQPVLDSEDSCRSKEQKPVEILDQSVCYRFLLGQSLYGASSLILTMKRSRRYFIRVTCNTDTQNAHTLEGGKEGWSKIWMSVVKLPM